jgi:hypothetical protein
METPLSSEASGIIYPSKQHNMPAALGLELIFSLRPRDRAP